VEISPYDVGVPACGISVPAETCGSTWNGGFLSRKCPELPLHFFQGMCGCAFAVLLKTFIDNGGETYEYLLQQIGRLF